MLYQPDRRIAPYLIALAVILFFVGVFVAIWTKNNTSVPLVTSFEECVEAGFPVMESYPRQCRANGELFIEEVPEVTPTQIPSPTEELIACTLDALICPDGTAVGRIPPDCEFEACPGE